MPPPSPPMAPLMLLTLSALVFAPTNVDGAVAPPTLDEICAVELARRTGDTQRTIEERLEPAHECTCARIPGTFNDAENGGNEQDIYEIRCTSVCDVCNFGKCGTSVVARQFTAEVGTDGEVVTKRRDEEQCVTYTSPPDIEGKVACIYTGSRAVMSVDGEWCDRSERLPCPSDESRKRYTFDCTALGDQVFDACKDNAEGLVPDPSTSLFAFLDGGSVFNKCGDSQSLSILDEEACAVEMARKTGDTQRTVLERFEPAHECTCRRVPTPGQSADATSDLLYEIRCVSTCDVCSYDKCASSVHWREFEADVGEDGAIETKRVSQNRCLTYTSPEDIEGKVACIETSRYREGFVSINNERCEREDRECPERSDQPIFDCTSVGDQTLDFCKDNDDGMVPDPSTSLFGFLTSDFVSNQCGGKAVDLDGLGAFAGRASSGAASVSFVGPLLATVFILVVSVFAR